MNSDTKAIWVQCHNLRLKKTAALLLHCLLHICSITDVTVYHVNDQQLFWHTQLFLTTIIKLRNIDYFHKKVKLSTFHYVNTTSGLRPKWLLRIICSLGPYANIVQGQLASKNADHCNKQEAKLSLGYPTVLPHSRLSSNS